MTFISEYKIALIINFEIVDFINTYYNTTTQEAIRA